jgi:hypothetical protein
LLRAHYHCLGWQGVHEHEDLPEGNRDELFTVEDIDKYELGENAKAQYLSARSPDKPLEEAESSPEEERPNASRPCPVLLIVSGLDSLDTAFLNADFPYGVSWR